MQKITVIIPVYNAPKSVNYLLKSLVKNSNRSLVDKIIIGNDCSDSFTTQMINTLIGADNIFEHIVRPKNLGFLANVNDLFTRAKSEIVVLLNSDVILPERWAERIIAAFTSDKQIGLACPLTTNATNLTIKPAPGQSWIDIDHALETITPSYPNCAPVVGFFLGIRKEYFENEPLLDSAYGSGYWEDTDLHFRGLEKGLRNVVIDNLFVFHSHHSPSFSINHNLPAINDANKKIFRQRWGAKFDSMKRTEILHSMPDSLFFSYAFLQEIDILFILPEVSPNYGGVTTVMNFVDELNIRGISAAVYTFGTCDIQYVNSQCQNTPFTDKEYLFKQLSKVKYVFSTSLNSHETAVEIACQYSSTLCCLVQGPETSFVNGKFAYKTSKQYQENDINISVSNYLCHFVESFGVKSTSIPLGPSKYTFYESDKAKRQLGTLAACIRTSELKGTGRLMSNLIAAKEAGFEIHLFGETEGWNSMGLAKTHGRLSSTQMSQFFRKMDYYLDCSYMEGLGLLPLEAAFSGCIPIVADINGLEGIIEDGINCIRLPREYPGIGFYKSILNTDNSGLRSKAVSLSELVSLEKAVEKFINILNLKPVSKDIPVLYPLSHEPINIIPTELMRCREQLDQIYNSYSWWLTKPVRFAGRVSRKIFKR